MGTVTRQLKFLLIFLLMIPSNVLAKEEAGDWRLKIEQIVQKDPSLQGAIAGISIRSAENGQILYNHLGDTRLRPASNLKLLTAAAALAVLGEGYTFSTEIFMNGKMKGNVLKGDLFLKGKGDPTLLQENFEKMAKDLRQKGIKKIEGNVLGDDSWYDQVRYSLDLPWSDEQTYYGAPISALTASPTKEYDAGTVLLKLKPNKLTGRKASISLVPRTNPLKVINRTSTVPADQDTKLIIERAHSTNTVIIRGSIRQNSKIKKEWIAVRNPTHYAVDLFAEALKNQGIVATGKRGEGQTPSSAHLMIKHSSMPLAKLLIPFMKLSNNGHAEILVKEMGKVNSGEGSWDKGLEVIRAQLPRFGINPAQIVMRDGSGVSHVNLITANQLSGLLFSVQKEKWFPALRQSLPMAGAAEKMKGGTMRKRLGDSQLAGKIRAKTGTISTVSSLSGYVQTRSGGTFIFSILLNNMLDESKGKTLEDKIIRLIAQS